MSRRTSGTGTPALVDLEDRLTKYTIDQTDDQQRLFRLNLDKLVVKIKALKTVIDGEKGSKFQEKKTTALSYLASITEILGALLDKCIEKKIKYDTSLQEILTSRKAVSPGFIEILEQIETGKWKEDKAPKFNIKTRIAAIKKEADQVILKSEKSSTSSSNTAKAAAMLKKRSHYAGRATERTFPFGRFDFDLTKKGNGQYSQYHQDLFTTDNTVRRDATQAIITGKIKSLVGGTEEKAGAIKYADNQKNKKTLLEYIKSEVLQGLEESDVKMMYYSIAAHIKPAVSQDKTIYQLIGHQTVVDTKGTETAYATELKTKQKVTELRAIVLNKAFNKIISEVEEIDSWQGLDAYFQKAAEQSAIKTDPVDENSRKAFILNILREKVAKIKQYNLIFPIHKAAVLSQIKLIQEEMLVFSENTVGKADFRDTDPDKLIDANFRQTTLGNFTASATAIRNIIGYNHSAKKIEKQNPEERSKHIVARASEVLPESMEKEFVNATEILRTHLSLKSKQDVNAALSRLSNKEIILVKRPDNKIKKTILLSRQQAEALRELKEVFKEYKEKLSHKSSSKSRTPSEKDEQFDAIEKILSAIKKIHFYMPTGAGKTFLAGYVRDLAKEHGLEYYEINPNVSEEEIDKAFNAKNAVISIDEDFYFARHPYFIKRYRNFLESKDDKRTEQETETLRQIKDVLNKKANASLDLDSIIEIEKYYNHLKRGLRQNDNIIVTWGASEVGITRKFKQDRREKKADKALDESARGDILRKSKATKKRDFLYIEVEKRLMEAGKPYDENAVITEKRKLIDESPDSITIDSALLYEQKEKIKARQDKETEAARIESDEILRQQVNSVYERLGNAEKVFDKQFKNIREILAHCHPAEEDIQKEVKKAGGAFYKQIIVLRDEDFGATVSSNNFGDPQQQISYNNKDYFSRELLEDEVNDGKTAVLFPVIYTTDIVHADGSKSKISKIVYGVAIKNDDTSEGVSPVKTIVFEDIDSMEDYLDAQGCVFVNSLFSRYDGVGGDKGKYTTRVQRLFDIKTKTNLKSFSEKDYLQEYRDRSPIDDRDCICIYITSSKSNNSNDTAQEQPKFDSDPVTLKQAAIQKPVLTAVMYNSDTEEYAKHISYLVEKIQSLDEKIEQIEKAKTLVPDNSAQYESWAEDYRQEKEEFEQELEKARHHLFNNYLSEREFARKKPTEHASYKKDRYNGYSSQFPSLSSDSAREQSEAVTPAVKAPRPSAFSPLSAGVASSAEKRVTKERREGLYDKLQLNKVAKRTELMNFIEGLRVDKAKKDEAVKVVDSEAVQQNLQDVLDKYSDLKALVDKSIVISKDAAIEVLHDVKSLLTETDILEGDGDRQYDKIVAWGAEAVRAREDAEKREDAARREREVAEAIKRDQEEEQRKLKQASDALQARITLAKAIVADEKFDPAHFLLGIKANDGLDARSKEKVKTIKSFVGEKGETQDVTLVDELRRQKDEADTTKAYPLIDEFLGQEQYDSAKIKDSIEDIKAEIINLLSTTDLSAVKSQGKREAILKLGAEEAKRIAKAKAEEAEKERRERARLERIAEEQKKEVAKEKEDERKARIVELVGDAKTDQLIEVLTGLRIDGKKGDSVKFKVTPIADKVKSPKKASAAGSPEKSPTISSDEQSLVDFMRSSKGDLNTFLYGEAPINEDSANKERRKNLIEILCAANFDVEKLLAIRQEGHDEIERQKEALLDQTARERKDAEEKRQKEAAEKRVKKAKDLFKGADAKPNLQNLLLGLQKDDGAAEVEEFDKDGKPTGKKVTTKDLKDKKEVKKWLAKAPSDILLLDPADEAELAGEILSFFETTELGDEGNAVTDRIMAAGAQEKDKLEEAKRQKDAEEQRLVDLRREQQKQRDGEAATAQALADLKKQIFIPEPLLNRLLESLTKSPKTNYNRNFVTSAGFTEDSHAGYDDLYNFLTKELDSSQAIRDQFRNLLKQKPEIISALLTSYKDTVINDGIYTTEDDDNTKFEDDNRKLDAAAVAKKNLPDINAPLARLSALIEAIHAKKSAAEREAAERREQEERDREEREQEERDREQEQREQEQRDREQRDREQREQVQREKDAKENAFKKGIIIPDALAAKLKPIALPAPSVGSGSSTDGPEDTDIVGFVKTLKDDPQQIPDLITRYRASLLTKMESGVFSAQTNAEFGQDLQALEDGIRDLELDAVNESLETFETYFAETLKSRVLKLDGDAKVGGLESSSDDSVDEASTIAAAAAKAAARAAAIADLLENDVEVHELLEAIRVEISADQHDDDLIKITNEDGREQTLFEVLTQDAYPQMSDPELDLDDEATFDAAKAELEELLNGDNDLFEHVAALKSKAAEAEEELDEEDLAVDALEIPEKLLNLMMPAFRFVNLGQDGAYKYHSPEDGTYPNLSTYLLLGQNEEMRDDENEKARAELVQFLQLNPQAIPQIIDTNLYYDLSYRNFSFSTKQLLIERKNLNRALTEDLAQSDNLLEQNYKSLAQEISDVKNRDIKEVNAALYTIDQHIDERQVLVRQADALFIRHLEQILQNNDNVKQLLLGIRAARKDVDLKVGSVYTDQQVNLSAILQQAQNNRTNQNLYKIIEAFVASDATEIADSEIDVIKNELFGLFNNTNIILFYDELIQKGRKALVPAKASAKDVAKPKLTEDEAASIIQDKFRSYRRGKKVDEVVGQDDKSALLFLLPTIQDQYQSTADKASLVKNKKGKTIKDIVDETGEYSDLQAALAGAKLKAGDKVSDKAAADLAKLFKKNPDLLANIIGSLKDGGDLSPEVLALLRQLQSEIAELKGDNASLRGMLDELSREWGKLAQGEKKEEKKEDEKKADEKKAGAGAGADADDGALLAAKKDQAEERIKALETAANDAIPTVQGLYEVANEYHVRIVTPKERAEAIRDQVVLYPDDKASAQEKQAIADLAQQVLAALEKVRTNKVALDHAKPDEFAEDNRGMIADFRQRLATLDNISAVERLIEEVDGSIKTAIDQRVGNLPKDSKKQFDTAARLLGDLEAALKGLDTPAAKQARADAKKKAAGDAIILKANQELARILREANALKKDAEKVAGEADLAAKAVEAKEKEGKKFVALAQDKLAIAKEVDKKTQREINKLREDVGDLLREALVDSKLIDPQQQKIADDEAALARLKRDAVKIVEDAKRDYNAATGKDDAVLAGEADIKAISVDADKQKAAEAKARVVKIHLDLVAIHGEISGLKSTVEKDKEEQERLERERQEKEQREREQREREQREREQKEREQKEREQKERERKEREQREREQREREQKERLEKEQREREQREQKERLEREKLEREAKEIQPLIERAANIIFAEQDKENLDYKKDPIGKLGKDAFLSHNKGSANVDEGRRKAVGKALVTALAKITSFKREFGATAALDDIVQPLENETGGGLPTKKIGKGKADFNLTLAERNALVAYHHVQKSADGADNANVRNAYLSKRGNEKESLDIITKAYAALSADADNLGKIADYVAGTLAKGSKIGDDTIPNTMAKAVEAKTLAHRVDDVKGITPE